MRLFIFVLAILFAVDASAQCDFPVPAFQVHEYEATGLNKAEFNQVLDEIEKVWAPKFQRWGCPLVLHRSWSDTTVNAQAWQEGIRGINLTCHVEMFGGFARVRGITKKAFKLVALHEIGHHVAESPFYPGTNLSCEGQADYFAGKMLKSRSANLVLSTAFARFAGEKIPWRPGPKLPKARFCGHPRGQCRLVTYDAGAAGTLRPDCWANGL